MTISLIRTFRTLPLLLLLAGAVLAGCDRSPLANDLSDARQAIREGDPARAEKYLERYLRTEDNPELRWEAWNELLDVVERGNQGTSWIVDGLETMLVEYEADPKRSADILFRLGEANEKTGRFERAAEYWSQYIEQPGLDPVRSAAVHRRLASLNFRLRRFEAAEENLHGCLALPVGEAVHAQCLYDLADNASTRELLDDADRFAHQVLDMDDAAPEIKSRAGFIVADIQEQRGQPGEALAMFETIRDAYPNPGAVDVRIAHLKKKVKK